MIATSVYRHIIMRISACWSNTHVYGILLQHTLLFMYNYYYRLNSSLLSHGAYSVEMSVSTNHL